MESKNKIVAFDEFCPKCKNENLSEDSDVCNECLHEPVNLGSIKPVNFEAK